jgi:hypothetical protein
VSGDATNTNQASGHECPICGVEVAIHDQTVYGANCNIRKPMLRMIIPIRSWLRTRAAQTGANDGP